MIAILIGLILTVAFLGVIWYCVQRLLSILPLPSWASTVIEVLMILIVAAIVFWFIVQVLGAAGVHVNMPIRL